MNNPYLWTIIIIGGVLIYLKIRSNRRIQQESDSEFLARKLVGAQRLQWVIIILILAGSLLSLVIGFRESYWILIFGVLGMAGGLLWLRVTLRKGPHPVVAALEQDPSRLSKLEMTSYNFAGMRTSAMAQLHMERSVLNIYLSDQVEKYRFLRILHERAPQLVPNPPAPVPATSKVQSGLRSLGGVVYVLAILAIFIAFSIWRQSGLKNTGRVDVRDSIKQYALNLNAELPSMLDENTRLDSAEIRGGGFFYNYTAVHLTKASFDTEGFRNLMAPQLEESACVDNVTRTMIDNDYPVTYAYHDRDGKRLVAITVTEGICRDR